jgi:hypothetical protein
MQDSDHELIAICNMCLGRLEGPFPLVKPYDDEQIATTVVKTSTKKPAVVWTVVIPTIGWKSLCVSASESNPVQKGNQQRRNIELTRLKGIAVMEGHVEATKGISLNTLRKIGVKLGLGQTQLAKKKRLCNLLVGFYVNKEVEEKTGVVSIPVNSAGQIITWNVTCSQHYVQQQVCALLCDSWEITHQGSAGQQHVS